MTIVQNRPTQFDAPLYFRLRERLDLHVYYTQLSRYDDNPTDREIGRSPVWDNVVSSQAPPWVTCVADWSVRDVARALRLRRPQLTVIAGYSPHPHAALAGMLKAAGMRVGLRSDNTLPHSRSTGVRCLVKRAVLHPCFAPTIRGTRWEPSLVSGWNASPASLDPYFCSPIARMSTG